MRHLKFISLKPLHSFTMIELMTVVAIIAILAVLTIPGFIHYIEAAKINSLWKLAEPAKLYVEDQYLKNNTAVTSITVNSGTTEFTTGDPSLVTCITIQGGIVSVVANPNSLFGEAFWVSWIPTVSAGQISWSCTYDPSAQQYIGQAATNCSPGTPQYSGDPGC